MTKYTFEEIIGKNLSQELLEFMIKQRIKEYGENTKDFENNEQESIFFFLKEDGKIIAFGTLKPVDIFYGADKYEIMGLENVIAIEKGKGYGTILMEHIKKYLKNNRFICIGNTHKVNFEFYKKCGFQFIHGLVERFIYIDPHGNEHGGDWNDYSMFLYDKDNKLDEVINGKDKIVIKIPLW